jgi:hypothetical protein
MSWLNWLPKSTCLDSGVILWPTVISDVVAGLCLFGIGFVLHWVLHRYHHVIQEIAKLVPLLVALAFLLPACGLMFVIDAALFWTPIYGLNAIVHTVTAGLGLAALWLALSYVRRIRETWEKRSIERRLLAVSGELAESVKALRRYGKE